MGAMIARVLAPAWLVLPPVRTPNCSSQPWYDGSYEASVYCSPRSDARLTSKLAQNGKLHPLAAAGTSDWCFTVSQHNDGPKSSKTRDQHQSPIFTRFAFAVRSSDHLSSGSGLVVIGDAQGAQSRRKPQAHCRSLRPTVSRVPWATLRPRASQDRLIGLPREQAGQSSTRVLFPSA